MSISQSAITEVMKELEGDLGVSVFERHSRGLNITHQGHQFLRHATNILANVAEGKQAFDDPPDQNFGSLQLEVTSLVAGVQHKPHCASRSRLAYL